MNRIERLKSIVASDNIKVILDGHKEIDSAIGPMIKIVEAVSQLEFTVPISFENLPAGHPAKENPWIMECSNQNNQVRKLQQLIKDFLEGKENT